MGVRYIEVFRRRYYNAELVWNRKLGINPLPFEVLHKRFKSLTQQNFKSESWFMEVMKIEGAGKTIQLRRNFPILNRYFADFYFNEIDVVVEIDGKSHSSSSDYDKKRDLLFSKRRMTVYRIKYLDLKEAKRVCQEISYMFKANHAEMNERRRAARKKAKMIPRIVMPKQERSDLLLKNEVLLEKTDKKPKIIIRRK